ncbi:hypothetical protein [Fibrella forsythiae]|uniref:Uncharacterized protein n=1 Tax=Fibrella forsythiae TaxID=2817061 RepID=A0ABS3JNG8_9BACT|nr:hypothetical protein [Fibrella forsythiae]MBO0951564.1 hypothetical protein [Fibrella forsythiae]
MARVTNEWDDRSDQSDEQQWQAHLAYETKTRIALEAQQKEEEEQSYLYEINLTDRALLTARHQEERKALLHQHRAMRIGLRKSHDQGE